MKIAPCLECGAEYENGWKHKAECSDYDPPREMTCDEWADMFGDLDPALFV